MNVPVVRVATAQDIAGLIPLYQEFHEFHVLGVPQRLRTPEHYDIHRLHMALTNLIQRLDIGLFVAEQAETLVEFVEVHLQEDPLDVAVMFHRYGHVQSLMVTASYRKAGLGRALVHAAKTWTATQGITQLRLDIWEFDAGPLHFYERLGFQTVKRELALDTTRVEW